MSLSTAGDQEETDKLCPEEPLGDYGEGSEGAGDQEETDKLFPEEPLGDDGDGGEGCVKAENEVGEEAADVPKKKNRRKKSTAHTSNFGGFVKPLFKRPSAPLADAYECRQSAQSRREQATDAVAEARNTLEAALADEREATAELEACTKRVFELELAEPCRWNENFAELKNFVAENGHCRLPAPKCCKDETTKKISIWLMSLKEARADGVGKICVAPHRVEVLEKLGVVWKESFRDRWMKRYVQLKAFQEEHGHCRVTKADDVGLLKWIEQQRLLHKKYKEGKGGCGMNEERIRNLDSIGFRWKATEQIGPTAHEDRWKFMFQKLKEYKEKNGHLKIPSKAKCCHDSNLRSLKMFLDGQRERYRRGQMSRTPHRIKALEELGLDLGEGKEERWAQRLQELVQFRASHGHISVPVSCKENPGLGIWVKNLKRLWRQQALPPERMEMVLREGIDFSKDEPSGG